MIDGVNVSECKYLNKVVNEEPYCNIDEEHLYTCSSDENCYFKQLARKTQECEELKEQLKIKDNENSNLNKKYRQEQDERRSHCKALEEIGKITASNFHDDNWVTLASKMDTISGIINNARKDNHVK